MLARDYPSAPANPSSLAKRDARGFEIRGGDENVRKKSRIILQSFRVRVLKVRRTLLMVKSSICL